MNQNYNKHQQRIIALLMRLGLKIKEKLVDEGGGEITKLQSVLIGGLIFGSVSFVEYESVRTVLELDNISFDAFIACSSVTGGLVGLVVNLTHSVLKPLLEKFDS